ncbi:MAG: branched-chain amino acid ABC transporter permease [Deltaproteobacteria bacterium]|nr:branched-chain amino acid ABC transporter permease [Deltaproteobacteria bacterium]
MEFFIISLINGLLYGLLLFMLSSGLTLIFGMMGVLNFAHASFYMLGAYIAYQISVFIGFWPALIISPIAVGFSGAMVEKYGLRLVHKYGHMAELLFTFGLAYLIGELVSLVWGRLPVEYNIPESLDFSLFTIFTTSFHSYRGFMFSVSLLMFTGLYLFMKKTRVGMIVQAALVNPVMVGELGHNVSRIFMSVFSVGCAMAGLAGVISGNMFGTEPGMADRLGLIVFVVVIVGGLGSLVGALIASIIIGVIQNFAAGSEYALSDLFNSLGISCPNVGILGIKISQTAEALPFLFMVLILIFRPKGLMGTRET